MNTRTTVMGLVTMVLLLAFAGFVPLALWSGVDHVATPGDMVTLLVLLFGLGAAVIVALTQTVRALAQYSAAFHDISYDEATSLVNRLLFDARLFRTRSPFLRITAGKVDLDAPAVVHKVGGPAGLSIDHDSAAVTSRLGHLYRVLGPGFHRLDPFERVWDVVDLRPQRRTIAVEFMTRDGIPALVQATIVSRIAGPVADPMRGDTGEDVTVYGYSEDAVLQVTTEKFVLQLDGDPQVSDWVTGMAKGALDGAIRDALERHTLAEFLNPQYGLREEEGSSRHAPEPELITDLEREIADEVRAVGRGRGIVVERVELGTIRPAEQAISRQWLEFWQAKLQKEIDHYEMEAEMSRAQLAEETRVNARVLFINRVLEEMQALRSDKFKLPPELVIASVTEALASMGDQGPEMRRLLFQQAESLVRAVHIMQHEDAPLLPMLPSQIPSPPEKS